MDPLVKTKLSNINSSTVQQQNEGGKNIVNGNKTQIFQPKLMINEKLTKQYGSIYINALREALFTHFEKPYKAPDIPLPVFQDGDNIHKYICRQCKDSFHHSSSLEEHTSRGSWILGYWCTHCFRECEHLAGKKLYCGKCIKLQIQKFKALQSRGLKKNDEPGIVKVFFNPCQLLEHMQMHDIEEISMHQLMLLPFPSGIGKEYYPHLKMISEALMDFMFLANIHIVDWLSQNKIHKWWRMAKGDNPVANIIKKYPFEVQQIKQLLSCNNKVNQIIKSNKDSTDITTHHNKKSIVIDYRTSLNSNDSSLNHQSSNKITLKALELDPQANLQSTEDITFVDCGLCDNERNFDIHDETVLELNNVLDNSNISLLGNFRTTNSTSSSKPKISVKKFAKVPISIVKDNVTINNKTNDPRIVTIRSTKPVNLTSFVKNFPHIAHKVANKKIVFVHKNLTKDMDLANLKRLRNNKIENISLLKTRKNSNKDHNLIPVHKIQHNLASSKAGNQIFERKLSILKSTDQQSLNSNKFKMNIIKRSAFDGNIIKSYPSMKFKNMYKVNKISQTSSETLQTIPHDQIVPVDPEFVSCSSTAIDNRNDNRIKLNEENSKLFFTALKKTTKKILEQFFHEDQLMNLGVTKNEKSGKCFLTVMHEENALCINDVSIYRDKMFSYLNNMSRAKVYQRVSHIKTISRKYSEKAGVLKDEIIEGHRKLISILQDIAAHIDSSVQSVGDEYFGPLLDSVSGATCSTCNKIMKPSEYLMGLSNIVADLDYCLCYDFICYKCNTFQGNMERFYAHLKYHKSEGPYICPECNICFLSFQSLNVHVWTKCFHPLVRRFLSCNICEIDGFCSFEAIVNHFVIMHSSKIAACNVCGMVFEHKRYCVSHMKKGHNSDVTNSDEPLQLTICQLDDTIIPIECYNYHMKNHKCVQETVFYKCNLCIGNEKLYKSQESIKAHVYKCHALELSSFIDMDSLKEIMAKSDIKQLLGENNVSSIQNIEIDDLLTNNISKDVKTSTSFLKEELSVQNKKGYDHRVSLLKNNTLDCNQNSSSSGNLVNELPIINSEYEVNDLECLEDQNLSQVTADKRIKNPNNISENILNVKESLQLKNNSTDVIIVSSLNQDKNQVLLLNKESDSEVSTFVVDDKRNNLEIVENKAGFEHNEISQDIITDSNSEDIALNESNSSKFDDTYKADRENHSISCIGKPVSLVLSNVKIDNKINTNSNENASSEKIFLQNVNSVIPTILETISEENVKKASINKSTNLFSKESIPLTQDISNSTIYASVNNELEENIITSRTINTEESCSSKSDASQLFNTSSFQQINISKEVTKNVRISNGVNDKLINSFHSALQHSVMENMKQKLLEDKCFDSPFKLIKGIATQLATERCNENEMNNLSKETENEVEYNTELYNHNLEGSEVLCATVSCDTSNKAISECSKVSKNNIKEMGVSEKILVDNTLTEMKEKERLLTEEKNVGSQINKQNVQTNLRNESTILSLEINISNKNVEQSMTEKLYNSDHSNSNTNIYLKNEKSPSTIENKVSKIKNKVSNMIQKSDTMVESVCKIFEDSNICNKYILKNSVLVKEDKSVTQSFEHPESANESFFREIDKHSEGSKCFISIKSDVLKSLTCESLILVNNGTIDNDSNKQQILESNDNSDTTNAKYQLTADVSDPSDRDVEESTKELNSPLDTNVTQNLISDNKKNTMHKVNVMSDIIINKNTEFTKIKESFTKKSNANKDIMQSEAEMLTTLQDHDISFSINDDSVTDNTIIPRSFTFKSAENHENMNMKVSNDTHIVEKCMKENIDEKSSNFDNHENVFFSRVCKTSIALEHNRNKNNELIEKEIAEWTNNKSTSVLNDSEYYENCKICSIDQVNIECNNENVLVKSTHEIPMQKGDCKKLMFEEITASNNDSNKEDQNTETCYITLKDGINDNGAKAKNVQKSTNKISMNNNDKTLEMLTAEKSDILHSNMMIHQEIESENSALYTEMHKKQSMNKLNSMLHNNQDTKQSLTAVNVRLSNNRNDSDCLSKERDLSDDIMQSETITIEKNILNNEEIAEQLIKKLSVLDNEIHSDEVTGSIKNTLDKKVDNRFVINDTTKCSIYKPKDKLDNDAKVKQLITNKKEIPKAENTNQTTNFTINITCKISEDNVGQTDLDNSSNITNDKEKHFAERINDIQKNPNTIHMNNEKIKKNISIDELAQSNKQVLITNILQEVNNISVQNSNETISQLACEINDKLNDISSENHRYSLEESIKFKEISQGVDSAQKSLSLIKEDEKLSNELLEVIKINEISSPIDLQIINEQISENVNKLVTDSENLSANNHQLKVNDNKLSFIEENIKSNTYKLKDLPLTDDEKLTLSKNPVSNQETDLESFNSLFEEKDNVKHLRTRIVNKLNNSNVQISKTKRKTSSKSLAELNASNDQKLENVKRSKIEIKETDTICKQKQMKKQKIDTSKSAIHVKGKLRNSVSKKSDPTLKNIEYSEENSQNKVISTEFKNAIMVNRSLKRNKSSVTNIDPSINVQKIKINDSSLLSMPTLRLIKTPTQINSVKFPHLSEKAPKLRAVKKHKIGFCSSSESPTKIYKFRCHLCGDTIDTSWTIISEHYNRKHAHTYELCMISPKLTRLSDNDVNDANQKRVNRRRKFIESSSVNIKRKKRWSPKKVNEKAITTAERTSGLFVQLESVIDGDGHFKCKKCGKRCVDMVELRQHIADNHRIAKKNLICLECGENFVVSPSLQMHLKAFHGIEDPIIYMNQYTAYAPDIVDFETEAETTAPNQCHVCMAVFKDKPAVDKHLRVHGMAFLNKKRIEARKAQLSPSKKEKFDKEFYNPTINREFHVIQENRKIKNSTFSNADKTSVVISSS